MAIRKKICTSPSSMHGCSSVSSWLWENNRTPIQTSYFIGPCNLHYLLFSGIGALLCHHPHCFPSQSQTLFGMGAGWLPITAIARWLFRHENTFDFAGGRGWGLMGVALFGIHIFFEIGKDHYYDITTIFMFFLSLGLIDLLSSPLEFLSCYSFSCYSITLYSLLRYSI